MKVENQKQGKLTDLLKLNLEVKVAQDERCKLKGSYGQEKVTVSTFK